MRLGWPLIILSATSSVHLPVRLAFRGFGRLASHRARRDATIHPRSTSTGRPTHHQRPRQKATAATGEGDATRVSPTVCPSIPRKMTAFGRSCSPAHSAAPPRRKHGSQPTSDAFTSFDRQGPGATERAEHLMTAMGRPASASAFATHSLRSVALWRQQTDQPDVSLRASARAPARCLLKRRVRSVGVANGENASSHAHAGRAQPSRSL